MHTTKVPSLPSFASSTTNVQAPSSIEGMGSKPSTFQTLLKKEVSSQPKRIESTASTKSNKVEARPERREPETNKLNVPTPASETSPAVINKTEEGTPVDEEKKLEENQNTPPLPLELLQSLRDLYRPPVEADHSESVATTASSEESSTSLDITAFSQAIGNQFSPPESIQTSTTSSSTGLDPSFNDALLKPQVDGLEAAAKENTKFAVSAAPSPSTAEGLTNLKQLLTSDARNTKEVQNSFAEGKTLDLPHAIPMAEASLGRQDLSTSLRTLMVTNPTEDQTISTEIKGQVGVLRGVHTGLDPSFNDALLKPQVDGLEAAAKENTKFAVSAAPSPSTAEDLTNLKQLLTSDARNTKEVENSLAEGKTLDLPHAIPMAEASLGRQDLSTSLRTLMVTKPTEDQTISTEIKGQVGVLNREVSQQLSGEQATQANVKPRADEAIPVDSLKSTESSQELSGESAKQLIVENASPRRLADEPVMSKPTTRPVSEGSVETKQELRFEPATTQTNTIPGLDAQNIQSQSLIGVKTLEKAETGVAAFNPSVPPGKDQLHTADVQLAKRASSDAEIQADLIAESKLQADSFVVGSKSQPQTESTATNVELIPAGLTKATPLDTDKNSISEPISAPPQRLNSDLDEIVEPALLNKDSNATIEKPNTFVSPATIPPPITPENSLALATKEVLRKSDSKSETKVDVLATSDRSVLVKDTSEQTALSTQKHRANENSENRTQESFEDDLMSFKSPNLQDPKLARVASLETPLQQSVNPTQSVNAVESPATMAAISAPPTSIVANRAIVDNSSEYISYKLGSQDWNKAIGQKVILMVAGNEQSAELSLNPPELGPLQVVLNINENQISANFISANHEVREAIEAAAPRLREMMDNAGVSLSGFSVNSQASQFTQQERQEPRPQTHFSGRNQGGDTRLESAPHTDKTRVTSGNNAIDTFV